MEDFYREMYAVNGVTDLKFPKHYPVSRLLGCVELVGSVTCDELVSWDQIPESVRLEGQTKFCWLCEQPQKLIIPFEMQEFLGIYNLERKVYEAVIRGHGVPALQRSRFLPWSWCATPVLAKLGLDIREAHSFSTVDGYSLYVFVVEGWSDEEIEQLRTKLERKIMRIQKSWQSQSLLQSLGKKNEEI